jgi:hypothetical protein
LKNYFLATLAAAALATDLAAPASAQTQTAYTNNPIILRHFNAYPVVLPIESPTFGAFDLTPTSSNVTISFVNRANVPAKSVEFAVRSGNKTALIVDKGTFAPGVRIDHTFSESPEFDDTSSVSVRAVVFADGSTWNG